MRDLQAEYLDMLDMQQFDESLLDYAVLERHVAAMTQLSALSHSMITIYDHFRRRHVYVSENHSDVFGLESTEEGDSANFDVKIHPDDFQTVFRNGVASMHYFFIDNKNAIHHKLVREYRIAIKGVYKRVSEQIQVLDTPTHHLH